MSEKKKDDKNRWKDYLIDSMLHQQVVAKGNPMMLVTFRDELHAILHELRRIQDASEMDEELLTPIRTMLEILEAFKVDEETEGKNEKKQFMERRQYRNV